MSDGPARSSATLQRSRNGVVLVVSVLIALVAVLASPRIVEAHTGFESSAPTEGATVDVPVDVVTIVFTGEATPVGDEFVALTPEGVVQTPVGFETVDNKTFTIRFDPPLAGGPVGIRWNVRAADAHPIEGAFSFTVAAAAPTSAASSTVAPEVPPAETTASQDSAVGADDNAPDDADVDAAAAAAIDDGPTTSPPATEPAADLGTAAAPPTQSLDEFLAVEDSTRGETTATVGRLIGFLGVALALGAFAFLSTAMRGRRDEIRRVIAAVRVLGVVVAVGAAVEYVGVSRIGGEALGSGWSTGPGFATVLRIVGGVGLAAGLGGSITSTRSLSAAVVDGLDSRPRPQRVEASSARWRGDARSRPAFAGIALIIASFWFDGHTVSKGFRPLHALVNSLHVVAGSVWVGGVVTMAAIVWLRHRSGEPMRVVDMVLRFSRVATVALISVVAAGAIMAFLVLDSFGDLTGTSWGQILLLKSAAVALAALGGAYNHFRLLPALEAEPESPTLLGELRSTVTAEAICLVFVVVVTAWLVASAA